LAVRRAHFTLTRSNGFFGVETLPRRFRESVWLSVVDRAVRIGLRVLAASEGAAITQNGFRHSVHRSLVLIRDQIVFDALNKTGKRAG